MIAISECQAVKQRFYVVSKGEPVRVPEQVSARVRAE